ncbi:MAG: hypothetical protein HZA02_03985 [Nitrospinae bacterium]|nr:hypothetical protein [Nitrospinota bacterium]
MFHEPRDLLIECKSCGVENLFANYLPETHTYCTQCRERLIDLDLNDTHDEYVCEDCGFSMLLLKDAPFEKGSTCRCGSASVEKQESSSIAEEAEEAGVLDEMLEAEEKSGDEEEADDETEEEEEELNEVDWFRSEPDAADDMDDYNEAFDNDPGY